MIKNKSYDEVLRAIGNVFLIAGYFTVLNYSVVLGCSLRILATALIMPYIIKYKLWDFAIVMTFFTVIDIHAMIGEIL